MGEGVQSLILRYEVQAEDGITMLDLSDTMVDLPDTMVDLPDTKKEEYFE